MIEQSGQKNYLYDPNNIYFKKDYESIYKGNPWNRRLSTEENTILFYVFKYVSYMVDYFRGIPIRYDRRGNKEPPITNMRFLSNYYNLLATFIFLMVIFLMIWLIIKLIRHK